MERDSKPTSPMPHISNYMQPLLKNEVLGQSDHNYVLSFYDCGMDYIRCILF